MNASTIPPRRCQGTESALRRPILMVCKHSNPVRRGKIAGFCVTSRRAAASAPVGTSPGINRNDSADRADSIAAR